MAELVFSDLPDVVLDRFADSAAAQLALDTALAAVRRYCGWHVSPAKSETIAVDGPGGRVLSLRTLNLTAVASVTELGVAVDVSELDRSQRKGTLTKQFGRWTGRDGAILAAITHGFDDAVDFNAAVLSFVDRWSLAATGVATGGLPNVVGPFQWPTEAMADGSAFSVVERSLLDQYRLVLSP